MGDVVPFRGKRRWTRPEDYGHVPEPPRKEPEPPPEKPRGTKRWRLKGWHFWLLASLLVGLWVVEDPALMEPPALLASEPEIVTGPFTICGKQRAENCVIDGDTFRLGDRSIRVIGIDAPETHPAHCDAEAEAGANATAQLQAWLNEGPFTMVGRIDDPVDKYGRELKAIKRTAAAGSTRYLAKDMVDGGTVRAYRGQFRKSWCPAAK